MAKKQQLLLLAVLFLCLSFPLFCLSSCHQQHLLLDLLKRARAAALWLDLALLVKDGRLMWREGAKLSRDLPRRGSRHAQSMSLLLLMEEMMTLMILLKSS